MRRGAVAAIALSLTVPAGAQLGEKDGLDAAFEATVRSDGPVHLLDCPKASCRTRAYLVPGDTVVVWEHEAGLASVSFVDRRGRGRDAAWLPAEVLVPIAAPRRGSLVGDWKGPERELDVRARPNGHLHIEGGATWGYNDPARREAGRYNSGDLDADIVPAGTTVAFAMGDWVGDPIDGKSTTLPYDAPGEFRCRIRLRLLTDYLIAHDNQNCGGFNVSFSNAYRRVSSGRASSTSSTGKPSRIG